MKIAEVQLMHNQITTRNTHHVVGCSMDRERDSCEVTNAAWRGVPFSFPDSAKCLIIRASGLRTAPSCVSLKY
jgi:hypothetical protein